MIMATTSKEAPRKSRTVHQSPNATLERVLRVTPVCAVGVLNLLEELTDRKLEFDCPSPTENFCFTGWAADSAVDSIKWQVSIDIRKGDVGDQLVSELRKRAKEYSDLANTVEAKLAKVTA